MSEKEDVEMESVKEEKEEEEKEEKEDEEEHEDGINNQLQQEYMYDSCIITKKWKQVTSNDRAMVLVINVNTDSKAAEQTVKVW